MTTRAHWRAYDHPYIQLAWPNVHFIFNEIIRACPKLTRLRLYGLHSAVEEESDGETMQHRKAIDAMSRAFEDVSLSQCAIHSADLKAIFAGSRASATTFHLEYPQDLPEDDLLEVLGVIDGSLKYLSVEGYRMQDTSDDGDYPGYLVDRILDRCPNLESLLFPEGLASPEVLPRLVKSKLRIWSFSCTPEVKPQYWLDAFRQRPPRTSKCYVRTSDWSAADLRKVRIAAWRAGVSWLESDGKQPRQWLTPRRPLTLGMLSSRAVKSGVFPAWSLRLSGRPNIP